jgi:hypothetical protein
MLLESQQENDPENGLLNPFLAFNSKQEELAGFFLNTYKKQSTRLPTTPTPPAKHTSRKASVASGPYSTPSESRPFLVALDFVLHGLGFGLQQEHRRASFPFVQRRVIPHSFSASNVPLRVRPTTATKHKTRHTRTWTT